MEETVWKSVPGYEGLYEVNNVGEIRGIDRKVKSKIGTRKVPGIKIKPRINRYGYFFLSLSKNGESRTFEVHRICALAFLKSIDGKTCVNHINGTKLDNRIENLEWVDHSQNMMHAIKYGLFINCKKVINICTGKLYYSIAEAARENEISASKLKRIFCLGQKNTTCLQLAG